MPQPGMPPQAGATPQAGGQPVRTQTQTQCTQIQTQTQCTQIQTQTVTTTSHSSFLTGCWYRHRFTAGDCRCWSSAASRQRRYDAPATRHDAATTGHARRHDVSYAGTKRQRRQTEKEREAELEDERHGSSFLSRSLTRRVISLDRA